MEKAFQVFLEPVHEVHQVYLVIQAKMDLQDVRVFRGPKEMMDFLVFKDQRVTRVSQGYLVLGENQVNREFLEAKVSKESLASPGFQESREKKGAVIEEGYLDLLDLPEILACPDLQDHLDREGMMDSKAHTESQVFLELRERQE